MSLRTKLLIFSIILALIPLGLAGKVFQAELIRAANDKLISVSNKVRQDIDDYTRPALLRLLAKTVETKGLGDNEKISLLTEAMKNKTDFTAFQIYDKKLILIPIISWSRDPTPTC